MTLPGLDFLLSMSTTWPLARWTAWHNAKPRTSQRTAVRNIGNEVTAFFGGVRCLAGETLVETPSGPRRIDSIDEPTEVWSIVNGERVAMLAYPTPPKGPDPLRRITLSDGWHFTATPAHRVLAASGAWLPVSELHPGLELASSPAGGRLSGGAQPRNHASLLSGLGSVYGAPGQSGTLAAAFGSESKHTVGQCGPHNSVPSCAGDPITVVAVTDHDAGTHYDLHVPGAGNFIADGVVHHNSGKTSAGFEIDLAHALGGDHPAVIAWMARNGIKWTIPDGPGRVWVVAATSNDSIRIHRPHFFEVIPDHLADWSNRRGRGESSVFIDVPGYSQKAEIWFKSADQDVKSMKGDACRLIHFDEEPEYLKWEEASLRTGYNGVETLRMLLTMQPDGMTWVHREIVKKGKRPSVRCHWLDSLDNVALPDKVRAQLKIKFDALPENVRKARKEGLFVNLEGLVYPAFSRQTHVIEPFEIPEDWPRFIGCDWGLGNPTAILWAALSPDGQIVIYKEHYKAKWPITKHARIVNAEHPKPKRGWSDPRDLQSGAELAEQTGIRVKKVPIRSVALGIDVVTLVLAVDEDTKHPGVVFFENLTHTIEEIEGYQWEDGKNEPKQVNDHTCDALRYVLVGIEKHTKRGRGGFGGIDSGEKLRRRSPWR